jgi:hypothetical protein
MTKYLDDVLTKEEQEELSGAVWNLHNAINLRIPVGSIRLQTDKICRIAQKLIEAGIA